MPLNAPIPMLMPAIGLFSAGAPAWSRRMNSVTSGTPAMALSAGAATLYAVNHPGTQSASRTFRFPGDGTTTIFTLPTAAVGIVYPVTAIAALTVINYLETIALTYAPTYAANAVVRQRVGSDAAPAGTQFRINGVTVTFGTAPAAGQTVEVLIPDPTTVAQLGGGAFTAGVPLLVTCRDFLTAGVAAVTLMPAGAR